MYYHHFGEYPENKDRKKNVPQEIIFAVINRC